MGSGASSAISRSTTDTRTTVDTDLKSESMTEVAREVKLEVAQETKAAAQQARMDRVIRMVNMPNFRIMFMVTVVGLFFVCLLLMKILPYPRRPWQYPGNNPQTAEDLLQQTRVYDQIRDDYEPKFTCGYGVYTKKGGFTCTDPEINMVRNFMKR